MTLHPSLSCEVNEFRDRAALLNMGYLELPVWVKRSRHVVVLLFSLSLVLRLAAIVVLGVPDPTQHTESGWIAAQLVAGKGYVFDFYGLRPEEPLRSFVPPAYTLLIALCMAISSQPTILLGVVQAFLSSLTPVCVHLVGKRLAGIHVGLLAGLATAFYPVFVIGVARPFSLSLNAFLLSSMVLLMSYMPTGGEKLGFYAVGIGSVLGLLSLSRSSMLGLFPGFAAWLWLNRNAGARSLYTLLMVASVITLILSPWLIRNYRLRDQMLPLTSNGGMTFWNGNNPFTTGSAWDVYADKARAYTGQTRTELPGEGVIVPKPYILPHRVEGRVATLSELALDRALYAAGFEFAYRHPREWLSLLLQKTVSFWWFRPNLAKDSDLYRQAWAFPYQVFYTLIGALFVLGIIVSFHQWRMYFFFYYLFAYLTMVYVAYNVVTRYRWEIEAFLLLFGTIGLVFVARWLSTLMPTVPAK